LAEYIAASRSKPLRRLFVAGLAGQGACFFELSNVGENEPDIAAKPHAPFRGEHVCLVQAPTGEVDRVVLSTTTRSSSTQLHQRKRVDILTCLGKSERFERRGLERIHVADEHLDIGENAVQPRAAIPGYVGVGEKRLDALSLLGECAVGAPIAMQEAGRFR
jgi:hypothetical protein